MDRGSSLHGSPAEPVAARSCIAAHVVSSWFPNKMRAIQCLLDWCQRWAKGLWPMLAVLLGLLQAVYFRYSMNPDGIAYLDMGDAYSRGDWATAVRSHWSPLYAWLLAAVLQLVHPAPNLEFPLVHMANFIIYCAALGTFTFLLRQIMATVRDRQAASNGYIGLPEWAWIALGYAAFIWCTLQYTPLGLVTPDLLVAVLVYAICGVMLLGRRQPRRRWSALLGGLLGLGYLAKAPMLPLALVFLTASSLLRGRGCSRISHLVVASSAMVLVALPLIVSLSVANGRPTVGDSARLNYLWVVDGVPLVHWQGGPDGIGQPLRHSELLSEQPSIFAFESPFPVTYTAWYAPEYWFEGATPLFSLGRQTRATLAALQAYSTLAADFVGVAAALAILLSMHSGPWRSGAGPALALLAPAVAAIGMYAVVLAEARYVAPFVMLLLLGLLLLVRLPRARWSAALSANVSVVMVILFLVQTWSNTSDFVGSTFQELRQGHMLAADDQALVASALRSAGIEPGDPVASGDRAFNAYWARLARVRIVAEVSERDAGAVLGADPAARAVAQRVLLAQKVRAVIARGWPSPMEDPGWQPIDGTDYFYHLVGPV
jgi:hypothetical protein